MNSGLAIGGFCDIRANKVNLNGRELYLEESQGFNDFTSRIYRNEGINYPKFHKMDNLSKLGFLASELIIRESKLIDRFSLSEIGIFLMNSSASLETDRNHQKTIKDKDNYFPSPSVFVYTLPNVVIGEICIRHKITGEGNFFISEKFDAFFLENYISALFEEESIKCCITGWVETDGQNYRSLLFLITPSDKTENGIANFEASELEKIYNH